MILVGGILKRRAVLIAIRLSREVEMTSWLWLCCSWESGISGVTRRRGGVRTRIFGDDIANYFSSTKTETHSTIYSATQVSILGIVFREDSITPCYLIGWNLLAKWPTQLALTIISGGGIVVKSWEDILAKIRWLEWIEYVALWMQDYKEICGKVDWTLGTSN